MTHVEVLIVLGSVVAVLAYLVFAAACGLFAGLSVEARFAYRLSEADVRAAAGAAFAGVTIGIVLAGALGLVILLI